MAAPRPCRSVDTQERTVSISNDLVAIIQAEGAKAYPNEACGVVVRVGKRKQLILACKNNSSTPTKHFLMDACDYADAAEKGEIVGIWHTHPEAPSEASVVDKVGCENGGVPWYIVGVYKTADGFVYDDMAVITPSGFELPYLERPYAFGVLDCYTLVRDFYRRDLGIDIPDGQHVESFWQKDMNPFGEGWKERGFVRLSGDEPKVGDIFLIQTTNYGVPDHIAVYIGDDMILHHCHGRLSRRDIYGGYWQKHTTHHLRHESKC